MSTTHTRIGPADQGRKMTLEEFEDAEETPGYRYELARGVLEVTEVPHDDHGQVVDNIHESFSDYRRARPGTILRIVHGSDVRLLIPELKSARHPDLAVVFRDAPRNSRGRQVPSLVVEVVSPGRSARVRDFETKREEYRILGIQKYWIVDPDLGQLTALVRRPGSTDWEESLYRGGETVESISLPGYGVPLIEFWKDLPTDL